MLFAQRILNPESLSGHENVRGRQAMVQILEAGLRAADPYTNTRRMLRVEGSRLIVGHADYVPPGAPWTTEQVFDLDRVGRILVLGAGKGIQRVAKAIEDVLGDRITGGHVIDKRGGELILERVGVTFGAHPVPDEGCVEGCRRILEWTRNLSEDDLVFTVVANGVSSLLTLPVPGVSLQDVRETTRLMQIERGAPTWDLNAIRNHLDQMKGGRLSRHLQPAQAVHILTHFPQPYRFFMHENIWLHSLPEGSTFARAIQMLEKWDAWEHVPVSVREHLCRADPAQETVKAQEFQRMRACFYAVMPRNLGMLPAAKAKAEELGFHVLILSTWLHAEASQTALVMADIANTVERHGLPVEPPCVLLSGGEMLVTVGQEHGMGGRNQEYSVAAALRITGSENIVMGSVDSDGTDGPGHQFVEGFDDIPVLSGGIVDGKTAQRARDAGIDLWDALKRHHTSPALYGLDSGVVVSHNVSLTDLTVTLVLDRGVNPEWTR